MNDFVGLLIFLTAAVLFVPLSVKLGLGSVLGYLLAGVAIGPYGFQLINNVEDVLHLSEFGVVLLLFIIGLELEPKKLWTMKIPIFGLGGLQVLINTVAISLITLLLGLTWQQALVTGMGFALSSTAMALQVMNEKKWLSTTSGRSAFSILLFQDIAVIPMIAILPVLVSTSTQSQNQTQYLGILKVLAIFTIVIAGGRFLLRPILRFIAGLHLREVFTAFALLLVGSMAYLMKSLEISMALGAFLAGVLLADSEYKHALETDIEPFKGLLLGLFFISVGMSVNIKAISQEPFLMLIAVGALFAIKGLIHWGLGRSFSLPKPQIPFFSIVISQIGEFAFVLFATATTLGILTKDLSEKLVAITALSMLATPVVVIFHDKILNRFFQSSKTMKEDVIDEHNPVIIAGFGRFGQIVGRLLYANKVKVTVLDHEPDQIELLRKFGFKVYYGDATRIDLLESAGIRKAQILVVAIDDVENNTKLVKLAKENFPHLKIFARARNIQHMYNLMDQNIEAIERETFEASLRLGAQVLNYLGWGVYDGVRLANLFRAHNLKMIADLRKKRGNDKDLIASAKQARVDLEQMLENENQLRSHRIMSWEDQRP